MNSSQLWARLGAIINEVLEDSGLERLGDYDHFQEVVIRGKGLIVIKITIGMTPTQSRGSLGVLLTSSPIKSCKSPVSLALLS